MSEIWFFYSDTCQPCKALKPQVQTLADALGVPVTYFDAVAEEHAALCAEQRIRSVPTVLLRRNGHSVLRAVGAGAFNPQEFQDALLEGED